MSHDLVLRCESRPFWSLSRKPRLTLEGPDDLKAPAGALRKAPPEWSREHRYYDGTSDVSRLIDWLQESLGSGLLRVISAFAVEKPARLFVTATDPQPLLATPWEVLAETHGDLQLEGNVNVIRSVPVTGVRPNDDIGASLRVLVTWADPSGNITTLPCHRKWIEALPKASDSAVAVEMVELTDCAAVANAAKAFRPNVVYHVGHASQLTDDDDVVLRIGPRNQEKLLTAAKYVEFLNEIRPCILVLNACSTITGRSLSPYIGIAQKCLEACESVVCMQAKVSIGAAKRFGERLLMELANGQPLSRSVQLGRLQMVAGQKIGQRAVPLFTKFIPVHLTRERGDPAFDVNIEQRDRLRSRKRLEEKIERVSPLLPRAIDGDVDELLVHGRGVAIITGPAGSGKSTTIRGRIAALLATQSSSRFLYISAKDFLWTSAPEHRIRQLLDRLVQEYRWLTTSLAQMLGEQSVDASARALSDLATWLAEEARANRRDVIVFDDLPDEVAAELASRGARSIDAGFVIAIARAPLVSPGVVARIDLAFMTEAEVGSADVLVRTGGMPYFVAAAMRGEPLDGSRLDARIEAASEEELHVLRLAGWSGIALPRQWLTTIGSAVAIDALVASHLLLESADRMATPEVVRDRVRAAFSGDQPALRKELFAFLDRISHETAAGPLERMFAIAAKLEAMQQALEVAQLSQDEAWLDRAADLAWELHEHYLREAGDALSAKAMWDQYREIAGQLGHELDPDVDTMYAEALAGVGSLTAADDLLDAVIDTGTADELQVRALLLRSNVLKRIGGHGVFDERVALLEEAVTIASTLVTKDAANEDLQLLLGNVEQSLGNALGYGAQARVPEAEQHLNRAARIFEQLGDLRAYRARGEIIEIRRYNDLLTEEARLDAIRVVREQLEQLVTRDMRRDAVLHLYELGRLENDPTARAQWFRRAWQRTDGDFSPLDLHAGLQWKLCELASGHDAVEEDVAQFAERLARWREDSWSLRLRRDALATLAERAASRGEGELAATRRAEALRIARHFQETGESRRDREAREALEHQGGFDGHRG